MLFLVRQGNPKAIRDWDDLAKPGVQVIVVNPRPAATAAMRHLARMGPVRERRHRGAGGGVRGQALQERAGAGQGRARCHSHFCSATLAMLITFESEVVSVEREFGKGKVDVVHPRSASWPRTLAVVERTVAKKGTAQLAKAYLDYLYSEEAQEDCRQARHLSPLGGGSQEIRSHVQTAQQFTVASNFGSLTEAQKVHFNDGGQFDKLYSAK